MLLIFSNKIKLLLVFPLWDSIFFFLHIFSNEYVYCQALG